MKSRRFFDFLTLFLLACTGASAHHTLRQDDAPNTQVPLSRQ
ncbi:MAG: hypothetical protein ACOYOF_17775 [Verrucomicrobiaceae bacterium]